MKAKKSVNLEGVGFEIGYALGVAEMVYFTNGARMVVTSARDGKHSAKSLHYSGRAVDIRTRNLLPETLNRVFGALRKILEPAGFDVVPESDHIHIEFQPKAGERLYAVTE